MATFLNTVKEDFPKIATRRNNLVANTLRREFSPAIISPYGNYAFLIRQIGKPSQVFYYYGDPIMEDYDETLVGELLPYKKRITFKEEDFDIDTLLDFSVLRNYSDNSDCPIARAFKRTFPVLSNVSVSTQHLTASPEDNPLLEKEVFFHISKTGSYSDLLDLYQRLIDNPNKEASVYLWGNLS